MVLRKTKKFSLEESIQFLEDDELCEVTPKSIRIRKRFLDKNQGARYARERK